MKAISRMPPSFCCLRLSPRLSLAVVLSACATCAIGCDPKEDTARAQVPEKAVFARLIELGALPEFVSSERVILQSDWKGGDAGLAELKHLPNLRELEIEWADVTNAGLKHIAALSQLERLRLRRVPIDNNGIATLVALQNLRALELPGIQIDDGAIPHIIKLKRLETLWLSGNPITDDAIEPLQALPALTDLNLDGTQVTDAAVPLLARMRNLREISFEDTKVSDAAIERLWESLPNVRVVNALGGFPAAKGEKLGNPGTP